MKNITLKIRFKELMFRLNREFFSLCSCLFLHVFFLNLFYVSQHSGLVIHWQESLSLKSLTVFVFTATVSGLFYVALVKLVHKSHRIIK